MKSKKISYLKILVVSIFLGCADATIMPIDSSQVIIEARVINYEEISTELDAKSYCYSSNWRDGVEIDMKKAFYVFAKIDNNLLAKLSESESLKLSDLQNENKYLLYGKYKNRWKFIDLEGNAICETDKSNGHKLIKLDRNDGIDQVIIGPLSEKPEIMEIEILNSKYYPNNLAPKYYLN